MRAFLCSGMDVYEYIGEERRAAACDMRTLSLPV